MSTSRLVAHDLRRLFLGIARASAASSCLVACAAEHDFIEEEEDPNDRRPPASSDAGSRDAQVGYDAGGVGRDGGVAVPRDGGVVARDAAVVVPIDAGPAVPKDAGVMLDATTGPKDASVLLDADPKDASVGENWERVPCTNGVAQPKAVLQTPAKIDYLGVHMDYNPWSQVPAPVLPDGGVSMERSYAERARVGVACAGVSDLAMCEQQVKSLKLNGPVCTGPDCRFALLGVGASYARIDQRNELIARLGSIDTVAEAVLVAAFDGHQVCPGLGGDARDIGLEVRALTTGGYALRATWESCGEALYQELFGVAADGTLTTVSLTKLAPSLCAVGRRAPGQCDPKPEADASRTQAGAFLAQAARLEAASIYAFAQLIRELSAHGAPESLRLLALDALLDEVSHAHEVAQLARSFGGDVLAPEVSATPLRSLRELALDNAHEGCVRETFGALLASYQAETAEDARVRASMARIAADETRHAQLSWQLMAWLTPQLSATERAEVAAEQRRARARLASESDAGLSEPERRALGMPTPEMWQHLLAEMDGAVADIARAALSPAQA